MKIQDFSGNFRDLFRLCPGPMRDIIFTKLAVSEVPDHVYRIWSLPGPVDTLPPPHPSITISTFSRMILLRKFLVNLRLPPPPLYFRVSRKVFMTYVNVNDHFEAKIRPSTIQKINRYLHTHSVDRSTRSSLPILAKTPSDTTPGQGAISSSHLENSIFPRYISHHFGIHPQRSQSPLPRHRVQWLTSKYSLRHFIRDHFSKPPSRPLKARQNHSTTKTEPRSIR